MTLLRRALAPVGDEAWAAIDAEARAVLLANLAARRFVDVLGPHGWEHAAVNLGRLDEIRHDGGVHWATRRVLPLVELRLPFRMDLWELDNLSRGAADVDLTPVRDAALEAARFEERAVYRGLPQAGIHGIIAASVHRPIPFSSEPEMIADAVANGLIHLSDAGVEGPYLIVLGESAYRLVARETDGYPLRKQLQGLVGHAPLYSPGLEGGLLVSTRGGDFRLSLGVDLSVGFDHADGKTIHLFLTESFTFRVTGPEAVVTLEPTASGRT